MASGAGASRGCREDVGPCDLAVEEAWGAGRPRAQLRPRFGLTHGVPGGDSAEAVRPCRVAQEATPCGPAPRETCPSATPSTPAAPWGACGKPHSHTPVVPGLQVPAARRLEDGSAAPRGSAGKVARSVLFPAQRRPHISQCRGLFPRCSVGPDVPSWFPVCAERGRGSLRPGAIWVGDFIGPY